MRLGIDVSHHQDPKAIDWAKIRAAGYDFAVIRACYGVRSDKAFEEHFRHAQAAGLTMGAYAFFRQTQGAEEQLEAFVGELSRVGYGAGNIYPVVDLEWNEDYDGKVDPKLFDKAAVMARQLAFNFDGCLLYLAPGFYQTLRQPAWMRDYPWWIAHYTSAQDPWCPWKQWSIWQHTGKGRVDGFSGDLDLNRARDLPIIISAFDQGEDPEPDLDDHEGGNATTETVDERGVELEAIADSLDRAAEELRKLVRQV